MNIKPTKLIIKNIGKIAGEQKIEINKPLILFYGEIRQGKSTILNCVRWVCGGKFPQDIITHGAKEGSITLNIDGGMLGRSFYKSKDGETLARPVVFVRNGKPVSSPVTEIKRFLNPFLLDQDFLRNKTELERKQYFTELFAVDTTELDTELFNSQRDAQQLRAKISGYGEIDLTSVEAVDTAELEGKLRRMKSGYATEKAELEAQLEKLSDDHQAAVDAVNKFNNDARENNGKVSQAILNKKARENRIAELKNALALERAELKKVVIPETIEVKPLPTAPDRSAIQKKILDLQPDTTALEKKIQDAGAQNVRAENYKSAKKRADEKKADEKTLSAMEKRQREIKAEKQAKLKGISEKCGIDGLEFDEAGNFIYQGTTAGMISDSQIMTLSSALSALYPEGFGLDLIDRAESLGKSIFEFVDRAKAEKKTIMATIVGERPAKVDPEIGVWVVEDGKVMP